MMHREIDKRILHLRCGGGGGWFGSLAWWFLFVGRRASFNQRRLLQETDGCPAGQSGAIF